MAYGQIVTMRLADGRTVEFADWSDKPLYSTVQILHGSTQQEMAAFTYVQGDPVPGFAPPGFTVNPRTANERDTNMAVPSGLSSEEEFLVFAIKPEVFAERNDATNQGNSIADFQTPEALCGVQGALTNSVLPSPGMLGVLGLRTILYLEISEKRFPQAGFNYFNTGFGPMAAASQATAGIATQGMPTQDAVRTLVIPSHIGGTEKFRVMLFNPDGVGLEVGYDADNSVDGELSCDTRRIADVRFYLDGLYRRGTA
jgi:hypothetical protein